MLIRLRFVNARSPWRFYRVILFDDRVFLQELAQEYKIKGVPTFVFIHKNAEKTRFSGADEKQLRETVAKLDKETGCVLVCYFGDGTPNKTSLDCFRLCFSIPCFIFSPSPLSLT